MDNIVCGLAALIVASVFYSYRAHVDFLRSQQRVLRDRVAYMLWVASDLAAD